MACIQNVAESFTFAIILTWQFQKFTKPIIGNDVQNKNSIHELDGKQSG